MTQVEARSPYRQARFARRWYVDAAHNGKSNGSSACPFQTVSEAASVARPGDRVVIRAGVYRERIAPTRGGKPGIPIVYEAAAGERVFIRGSDTFRGTWEALEDGVLLRASLQALPRGEAAYDGRCDPSVYGDFNPYVLNFNRERVARPHARVLQETQTAIDTLAQRYDEVDADGSGQRQRVSRQIACLRAEFDRMSDSADPRYRPTLGQLFIDGEPMREMTRRGELERTPGSWMIDANGESILLHPPRGVTLDAIEDHLVELTTRHTVFAPLERGLGYITLRGITFEHAANHFPTWGSQGWAQAGLVSTRSGHHWVIERCVIRHAKGVGLDCGSEGGIERMEHPGDVSDPAALHTGEVYRNADGEIAGHHLIAHNDISDNGHCGIAGIGHVSTRVLHNRIERNNADGWASPWWEFAGIKFHFFYDGLIEGNLIRDNDAHGVWLDNQWKHSRVTRNVILNNLWSGINVELGRGPLTIDHNVIAHTRQGDGVYGHDLADVTIAHNLLYANANYGAWFAYATSRVKPEDGCWDIKVLNNLILGNRAGALGMPMPWRCAGDNLSDGNLFMGAGQYLDEGGGPTPPRFQFTNHTHMGFMQEHFDFPVMTRPRVRELFVERLHEAGVPRSRWPNLDEFDQHWRISLDLWQSVLGNDQSSAVTATIKDNLATRRLHWQFNPGPELDQTRCHPIANLTYDYFGQPYRSDTPPKPGPFQDLVSGEYECMLWPISLQT